MAESGFPVVPTISPRAGRGHRGGSLGRGPGTHEGLSQVRASHRGRGHRGDRADRGVQGRGRGRAQNDQGENLRTSYHDFPDQHSTVPAQSAQGEDGEEMAYVGQKLAPLKRSETAETDAEVCFICATSIEHISIAPCNHQTCHICALRLRALYKTRACAHCRTEAPFVIFTDDGTKRYEEFAESDFAKVDENLGIKYEKDVILEDTILLLRYNCPDRDCDVACLGWPDLHRHVRSQHNRVMCDLCTRHKMVFTHEHDLFTYKELHKHAKYGDDHPGAVDQSGFKGHPECGFCKERFYGDDELYKHCREKHEKCHICDRRNGGRNPQYYLDYEMLEKHFAEAHFVCLDAECQANKTNVFESEMDLKAHQLSEHPNGLSKDARRDARLVDISGFAIREPYRPERSGRGRDRDHRYGGRGRDPNAEPLPASSAQPIGRAELAYQRQMAIHNAQSGPGAGRTFGGSLTQPTPAQASRPSGRNAQAQPVPEIDSLTINDSAPRPPQTPQEQARQLRHNAVSERAANLLQNDQKKLETFRNHVSSYKSSVLSATDLIDGFFSLFDCQAAELGKLVRELAEIYENEAKKQQLLEAWNSWRSINEDYPSLPGQAGTLPGSSSATTGTGGRRVLRLKSSTAQSSRSAVSRQGSWGNTLVSGSRDPFSALNGANGAAKKTPAWAPGPTPRGAPSTSIRPATRPPATRGARAHEEMFPSLPAAAKPNTLMAGVTRGAVRWNDQRNQQPALAAWGPGGMTPTPAEASTGSVANGEEMPDGVVAKKKGKKGKGQVFMSWG